MGSDGRVKATLQVNGGVSFDVGGDFEVCGGIGSQAKEDNTAAATERGKHGNGVRGRIEPHTHMVNLELRQCRKHD